MKEHIESANRLVSQFSESRQMGHEHGQILRVRERLVEALGYLMGNPVKIVAFPLNERHLIGSDPISGEQQIVTIPYYSIQDGPRDASEFSQAVITEVGSSKICIESAPLGSRRESEPFGYDVSIENIISISEFEAEQPEQLEELSN